MIFQRKYGTTTTSDFYCVVPVIKRGVVDFTITGEWSPAAGDVRVSKDGGANWSAINTLPTMIATGNNAGTYLARCEFLNTELQCKQLLVSIGDAATKAIEDTYFIVETYGHASAMYPRDISTDNSAAEIAAIAAGIFKFDLSTITGEARRSLLNAVRKIMNKWSASGGVLTIYKEDDSTSAFTEALTSAAGNPVTGSDPN
jgi:hypothetical protein